VNPYEYSISLRVFHPNLDPLAITHEMGLDPKRAWKAGDPRLTPKGTPLEGIYRESYWLTQLVPNGEGSSKNLPLEVKLDELVKQLDSSREFFARIRTEGGRVEFFIGMFGLQSFGFELSPLLLGSVESLGLALHFDIYPSPQNS
jgi:hypothetical protein